MIRRKQNSTQKEWLDVWNNINIPLPKFYFYEKGFILGTGPYSSIPRQGSSLHDCWEYVYRYDPGAVAEAGKLIESAYDFLRRV